MSAAGFEYVPPLAGVENVDGWLFLTAALLTAAVVCSAMAQFESAAWIFGVAFLVSILELNATVATKFCPTHAAATTLATQAQAIARFNREVCVRWCRSTHLVSAALQEAKCWMTPAPVFNVAAVGRLPELGLWCAQATEEFVFLSNSTRSGISPFEALASAELRGDDCVAFVAETRRIQNLKWAWMAVCGVCFVGMVGLAVYVRIWLPEAKPSMTGRANAKPPATAEEAV